MDSASRKHVNRTASRMSKALWMPGLPLVLGASVQSNPHWFLILMAVGACVLVVWLIRRIRYPSKLRLSGSPGRPNRVNPLHVVFLLLIWFASRAMVAESLKNRFDGMTVELHVLAASCGQAVWLAGSLAVAAFAFRGGLRRGLGLSVRHWPWDSVRAVLAYLALLPVAMGMYFFMTGVLPPDWIREHELLVAMRAMSAPWKALAAVSAVVLAPLSEEIFFRGLFQSMIRMYTRRPWVAILVTELAFAAVHIPLWHTLPSLFLLSVVLGYNYARCGRLLAPILIHAVFNGVTVVSLLLTG